MYGNAHIPPFQYRKLYFEIDAKNAASVALAERLDFVCEGCLREHEVTHAGPCDLYIYGALKRDWLALRSERAQH